ncbi:nucleotide sugar dehydrogenase [Sphingomonas sp. ASV193]|uniref:nucleotide sugar dehydrogenase n=1 Tax=Sphingomonas sp. ASV193 TaxID=3144405 RepID=UPI0032E88B40
MIGLGYVGLPLAVALARKFDVVGFDIDQGRVEELKTGHDRTGEIDRDRLVAASRLELTADAEAAKGCDLYLITVPTPVDARNRPDLKPLLGAARAVGAMIDPAKRPTVVVESTVYPGCTEDEVGPAIEAAGGLVRGRDFRLGYSPERINPGDKVHTVDKIVKVIAGEDDEVTAQLAEVYGVATEAGTYAAASIRAAEAAKAIENAQRDINIAFMNEVAQIVGKLGISIWDVLDAAGTKWNFLNFQPGLVGGHCIGVDPYYLAHAAEAVGHEPRVVLAGRGINDAMSGWIADRLHERRGGKAGRVLVLGLTFKEDVPDLRNSKVGDLARRLSWLGHEVSVADPLADATEAKHEYGLDLVPLEGQYDLVIGAVPHEAYRAMAPAAVAALVSPGGTLADLKGLWRGQDFGPSLDRWSL